MATTRQQKTLQNIAKGMTMKDAMKRAGYSDAYAHNPDELKKKKSWQVLATKYFSEEKIAKTLDKLLKTTAVKRFKFTSSYSEDQIVKIMKSIGFPKKSYFASIASEIRYNKKGDAYEISYWEVIAKTIDGSVVPKAVDMAIKSWGNYAPEKMVVTEVPETTTKEQKEARIKELEAEKKALENEEKKREEELRLEYYKEAKKKTSKQTAKKNEKSK